MTAGNILALFGAMLVLSIAPGPADFAVVARSLASGVRQGLVMIAGIVVADLVFILAALYSLAEIAESMGGLFLVLKTAGAAYLIWLGIGALGTRPAATTGPDEPRTFGRSSFLAGLLITLADPKAIFFYLGLLPAFVDLARATATDALIIMAVATVVITGVKGVFVLLAGRVRGLFNTPAIRRKLDIAAGIALIATGVFVAIPR